MSAYQRQLSVGPLLRIVDLFEDQLPPGLAVFASRDGSKSLYGPTRLSSKLFEETFAAFQLCHS